MKHTFRSGTTNNNNAATRSEWWRQSVVKRTLARVEEDIQHVLAQSPFLRQSEPGAHVALFHRSEIRTGVRLGKGGFSYVYEIQDFELNPEYSLLLTPQQQSLRKHYREQTRTGCGRYAIKFLQKQLVNDPKAFQTATSDLAIEAAYMSALNHPNILSVRGLPIHGLESLLEGRYDSYFIVFDRLEETLDRRIIQWRHQGDVSALEKAAYALDLAKGLAYLHQLGILFRDLKPSNLGFLNGKIQLLDFGLCREIPERNSSQVFEMSGVGTRRYMAVEVVNTSYYNDKADVFSWAMVFWEMLTLQKPYPEYSIEDHKRYVCQGGERPSLTISDLPQDLMNLLKHSWKTCIQDRLSMKEVECLLRSYIESCKMLDETPDITAVEDDDDLAYFDASTSLMELQLPFVMTETSLPLSCCSDKNIYLLEDAHLPISVPSDMFATAENSSLFESVGAAGTDVSSFDDDTESLSRVLAYDDFAILEQEGRESARISNKSYSF